MEILKEILKNKWVKLAMSALTILYTVLIGWFAYMSLFFDVAYKSKAGFIAFYLLVSAAFIALTLLTRRNSITIVNSIALMIVTFPLVLLSFGDWLLIVPAFVSALTAFFGCKSNGNYKTIMGTLFLLMYVVGGLAFFVVLKLFFPPTEKNVVESGLSASGAYRYEVWEITDNSGGSMKVMVEPNDKDEEFLMMEFKAKGYSKIVYNKRNREPVNVQWKAVKDKEFIRYIFDPETGKRDVIKWTSNDILYINGKEYGFQIGSREIVLN